jgi:sugar phosphate isomerase/epimerase
VAGAHIPLDALENDLGRVIDDAKTLDTRFVTCPYLPDERRQDADGYRRVGEALTRAGARLAEADVQLCYHNHAFEFDRFDGQTGFDLLFGAADPKLVQVELDTFWARKAGEDPAALLRRYAGRVPLIHLKDMTADAAATFAEVGEGVMDFPAIFDAAETAGGRYYIVEQDVCRRPPLESVRISFENLRKMGMIA